jgi:hypothetical protein
MVSICAFGERRCGRSFAVIGVVLDDERMEIVPRHGLDRRRCTNDGGRLDVARCALDEIGRIARARGEALRKDTAHFGPDALVEQLAGE